jgi:hypothetical protein
MKIVVRTVASGDHISFDVDERCTAGILKELIHLETGVTPDFQELRYELASGQNMILCRNEFLLGCLDAIEEERVVDLLYNLGGGDDGGEEEATEYGPSPDHVCCCCGVRSIPGEKLICCLTVGCGIRENRPLCEVCFSSCTCTLL